MRAAFAAADGRTTAYLGAGPAEPTRLPNDWRRFLDLVEELGGAQDVDELLATWALTDDEAATLAARSGARDAYHALVADGDGWAAPAAVRLAMDAWAFDDAEAAAAAATRVLERRDETEVLAQAEGLTPSGDLEAAYEARPTGRAGGRRDARRRDAGLARTVAAAATPAAARGTGWRPSGSTARSRRRPGGGPRRLGGRDPAAAAGVPDPPRPRWRRRRSGVRRGAAGRAAVAVGLAVLVAVRSPRGTAARPARRAAAATGPPGPARARTVRYTPPSVAPGAPFDAAGHGQRARAGARPATGPGRRRALGPDAGPPSNEERGAEPS